jgi:hypothetical protein
MPIPSSTTEPLVVGSSNSLVAEVFNAASFTFLKYYIKGYRFLL